MTRPRHAPADDEAIPVGTDADEHQDAGAVLAESRPSADEDGAGRRRAAPRGRGRGSAPAPSAAPRLPGPPALQRRGRARRGRPQPPDLQDHRRRACCSAWLSMVFRGFNFGIDFAGRQQLPGARHQRAADRDPHRGRGRRGAGRPAPQVVGGNTVLLRTAALDTDQETAVKDAVAKAAGVNAEQVSPESVSADWGGDITNQALIALVVFLVAVVRVPGRCASSRRWPLGGDGLAAARHHHHRRHLLADRLRGDAVDGDRLPDHPRVLALRHRRRVRQGRREHQGPRRRRAHDVRARRPTSRSTRPSCARSTPRSSRCCRSPGCCSSAPGCWASGTLKDLALVLFVGLAAGTYSSIFLATPIVADLKEREPAQQALRKRVLARRAPRRAPRRLPAARPVRSPAPAGPRPARGASVAVAERPSCPEQVGRATSSVESPASVRPEPGDAAATSRAAAGRPPAAAGAAAGPPARSAGERGRPTGRGSSPLDELIAAHRRRRPGLPRAGRALPRPDAGVRRRRRLPARGRRAGRAVAVDPRAAASPGDRRAATRASTSSSAWRPAASCWPPRSRWTPASASCRCARRASCRASAIAADYDAGVRHGDAGAAHRLASGPGSGCWSSTTCSPPAARSRRRSRWSSSSAAWSTAVSVVIELAALGGRQRIAPHAVHALWTT